MASYRISTAFITTMIMASLTLLAVIQPYYGAVLWAVILAILFHPLYLRALRWTGGKPGLAAFLSVMICILLVVIPFFLLISLLAAEAARAYQMLTSTPPDIALLLDRAWDALPEGIHNLLERLNLPTASEVAARFSSVLQAALQFIGKGFYSFSQGAIGFTIAFGVSLYLLFFMFRDGVQLAQTLRIASPLTPRQTDVLLNTFTAVVTATVKGNIIIAAIQGAIGGVTLWLLGVGAPILWGVVMAVLSLIPAVGAGLIWAPIAVYLLMTGAVAKGVILLLVGTFGISLIDNLLRPRLVGGQINMPDYLVLVSTLGGLAVLGVNGFVVGPLIAAIFLAVWRLYIEAKAEIPLPPPEKETAEP